MQIEIKDDFDLEKIMVSGQCFRVRQFDDGTYRFVTGDCAVYIRKMAEQKFFVSCDEESWKNIWSVYFDLDRCYREIYNEECDKHPFIREAMGYGRGLRVLRQNPWEMLITFIISQRKNIPAISKAVEMLALKYGHDIDTEYETLRSFPSPQEMACASADELMECSLGYRTPYVLDAIKQVQTGNLDLNSISDYGDEELLGKLQTVHGIGKKVANCVGLFGYGRTACVPVDVWISRAIENECKGKDPFHLFGENAGIIQQYVFYYEKQYVKNTMPIPTKRKK